MNFANNVNQKQSIQHNTTMNTLSAEQRTRLYENMKTCSTCRGLRNRSRVTRRKLERIEFRRFMQNEGTSVDPWRRGLPAPVRRRHNNEDDVDDNDEEETLCTEDKSDDDDVRKQTKGTGNEPDDEDEFYCDIE
jgi:hypothetical protein